MLAFQPASFGILGSLIFDYEKGNQCLELQLDHSGPEGYQYGDHALQIRGVSNLQQ